VRKLECFFFTVSKMVTKDDDEDIDVKAAAEAKVAGTVFTGVGSRVGSWRLLDEMTSGRR
jgi:hypothetical protein